MMDLSIGDKTGHRARKVVVRIVCDDCKAEMGPGPKDHVGWQMTQPVHRCPKCVDARRGSNLASAIGAFARTAGGRHGSR